MARADSLGARCDKLSKHVANGLTNRNDWCCSSRAEHDLGAFACEPNEKCQNGSTKCKLTQPTSCCFDHRAVSNACTAEWAVGPDIDRPIELRWCGRHIKTRALFC